MVVQDMMPLPSVALRKFSTRFYLTQGIPHQIHTFHQTRMVLQFHPSCPGTKQKFYRRRDCETGLSPSPHVIQTQSKQAQGMVPSLSAQDLVSNAEKVWAPSRLVTHAHPRLTTSTHICPSFSPSQRSRPPLPNNPCFYSAPCLLQDPTDHLLFHLILSHFTAPSPLPTNTFRFSTARL